MDEQTKAIQKALVKVIGVESAEKVANLKGEELKQVYNLVYEQASYHDVLPEEITVKDVIQEMYFNVHNDFIRTFEPEESEDFLIQRLMLLSELLGFELED
ncbi:hypothetical protein OMY_01403 [Enterococcus sulfureus ATCC 49903]|uniref:Uncharacterized protein n=1 Tax=Enterococcus sulfureus ATCC 49903 TaxID=1140003 RepID=S0L1I6_9ENTE|nr:hypothetical protein [Enterococcus sulfureus]EOT47150.1 hypothetical protein OMY_01403 [Enterococcus sulfureus ATCC 49903]EOT83555.1 hypothetical protein I573_01277 [Enterococcus sulfureus ATCC 49903]